MLTWRDVTQFTNHGNPKPDCTVDETDAELGIKGSEYLKSLGVRLQD